jgi:ABC-2 type transport system permease protein
VFTEIVGLDKNVPNYGVYILFALVLFQFFSEATGNCVNALVVRENLLRKIRFPRLVIPVSVVLTALFNLGMTLIAVFVFAIASGVYPAVGWLELPLIVALMALLATGVGLLLSALYVRYRDVQPIWEVATQMLFYASPVLYVATMVPESYQRAYLANPISALLTEMRRAVVDPGARHVWDAIGGAERLLLPGGIVLGVFALGFWVFRREAPRIAENL